MPFHPNVPIIQDKLNQSQQDLLDNFAEIDTFFSLNHGTFGNADQGKHTFVDIPISNAIDRPLDVANTGLLFSSLDDRGTFPYPANLGFKNSAYVEQFHITKTKNVEGRLPFFPPFFGYAYKGTVLIKWGVTSAVPIEAGTFFLTIPSGVQIPRFRADVNPFVLIANQTSFSLKPTGVGDSTGFEVVKGIFPIAMQIPFLAIGIGEPY